ncbi:riboflavin synthase [Candidatus Riesia pediculicola]|uniref:Riboflavin synthase n=1 Tax=Riesia pediculicola (strain USDA) TaxID=515618 RepID=D4G8P0_RIEPU|nr:riboflavin synthase [Candidatus Riesia pediculicola]ADD79915.1 riboflavin synthase, alpha subunit [Candidatus Riesia pediculicola USDA]ARC53917.1 riboflavin synthase subunit alpha [Candidatus Riesia pediculicola]ARC54351.1 riboflavin synthase subunit alpha [Candidatus Riesia pediculicola]QOJ86546.1 riboflavin synthase [Candidatus Riesia pediculicola]
MFTGIVQGVGKVVRVLKKDHFQQYTVKFPKNLLIPKIQVGMSISNNGCCLSVTKTENNEISFDLIRKTLEMTNFGNVQVGDLINLERSIRFGDEIGGHLMSGHIFTIAKIIKISKSKNNLIISLSPKKIESMNYILETGFIGIDGISLTVGKVLKKSFHINLIPETIRSTNISKRKIDDFVNVEIDPYTQSIVETTKRIMQKK